MDVLIDCFRYIKIQLESSDSQLIYFDKNCFNFVVFIYL